MATTTPKKKINEDSPERGLITKEEAEPTVAFGKPPPLPPVLGPLVALSLLETWSSRDGDDDWCVMWSYVICCTFAVTCMYKCIIYRLLLRTVLSFTWKRSLECKWECWMLSQVIERWNSTYWCSLLELAWRKAPKIKCKLLAGMSISHEDYLGALPKRMCEQCTVKSDSLE